MRCSFRGLALLAAALAGGCSGGILDPKGPVASAERLLLINSTAIMLGGVVPVIVATLVVSRIQSARDAQPGRGL
jgi:cytochrome o ubiquinol oxidase subunit 2